MIQAAHSNEGVILFVFAFLISGFCGLGWLLRSTSIQVTFRTATSAVLNSGMLGLVIALLWHESYHETPYFLLGICGLVGIGGVATVEICSKFVLKLVTKYMNRFGVQLLSDDEEESDVSE